MSNIIDMQAAREKKAEKDHGERQVISKEEAARAVFAGDYYLTIENDAVAVQGKFGPGKYQTLIQVKDAETLFAFFANECKKFGLSEDDLRIMSSSSLDFPEEYTEDPKTLELCDVLGRAG